MTNIKPNDNEQKDCLIGGAMACTLIRDLSLSALIDDTIGFHNEVRRESIQDAHGRVCLVQKRCNTFIHRPERRGGYPCSGIKEELLEVIVNKQRIFRK